MASAHDDGRSASLGMHEYSDAWWSSPPFAVQVWQAWQSGISSQGTDPKINPSECKEVQILAEAASDCGLKVQKLVTQRLSLGLDKC
eukprot:4253747-Karenia_brevis.AAC.1